MRELNNIIKNIDILASETRKHILSKHYHAFKQSKIFAS